MYVSSFMIWTLNVNMLKTSVQEDLIFYYGERKFMNW